MLCHVDPPSEHDLATSTSNLINSRREKDYLGEGDIERASRLNKMNFRFTKVANAIFQR